MFLGPPTMLFIAYCVHKDIGPLVDIGVNSALHFKAIQIEAAYVVLDKEGLHSFS